METIEKMAELTGFDLCDILGRARTDKLSICRQVCWVVMNENGHSPKRIASLFRRDISTIYYGIRRVKDLLSIRDRYTIEIYATMKNARL